MRAPVPQSLLVTCALAPMLACLGCEHHTDDPRPLATKTGDIYYPSLMASKLGLEHGRVLQLWLDLDGPQIVVRERPLDEDSEAAAACHPSAPCLGRASTLDDRELDDARAAFSMDRWALYGAHTQSCDDEVCRAYAGEEPHWSITLHWPRENQYHQLDVAVSETQRDLKPLVELLEALLADHFRGDAGVADEDGGADR